MYMLVALAGKLTLRYLKGFASLWENDYYKQTNKFISYYTSIVQRQWTKWTIYLKFAV